MIKQGNTGRKTRRRRENFIITIRREESLVTLAMKNFEIKYKVYLL